jgi:asparagine synthetase B (glutamine-hydrolysing)
MCGILFCLCRSGEEEPKYYRDYLERCRALVKRRGPDVQDEHQQQEEANGVVSCYSSVLWLQVITFLLLRLLLAASVADPVAF